MPDSSPTRGEDYGAVDPTRPLRTTLRGVATVVAPTSLVTALLYYFGWARTSYQARQLGLDDSLFGYSTEEYLLRSIDAMYWPLFVGTLVSLAGLVLHGALVDWAGASGGPGAPKTGQALDKRRQRLLTRLWVALSVVGVVSLGAGGLAAQVDRPSRLVSMATPICVTAGIVLVGYALHVRFRFLRRHQRPASPPSPELRAVRLAASSLVVMLLLLSLFWTVSRYAAIKGIDLAVAVERALPDLPDVTLYSAKRMHLQPPVKEAELAQPDSAYRFAYTGLKFLFRSERKLFLRPSDPSGQHVNIIIPESQDLRVELVRR
jgi:hypothetical protein